MYNYLIAADYAKSIQTDNLNQVIGSNQVVLLQAQIAAEARAKGILRQKYDLTNEFRPTVPHDKTQIYKGGAIVYLNAPEWNGNTAYNLNDLVASNGSVYICIIANTGAFVTTNSWLLVNLASTIYFAQYPQAVFNNQTIYSIGNQVFWRDKVYTCAVATRILSHDSALQIGQTVDSDIINTFPDDTINGVANWGTGASYATPAGTLITNTTYWTEGDNRDPLMVSCLVDIVLYYVHKRISPRNIPELRAHNYHEAITWLKDCAEGHETPDMAVLQPKQGRRIRSGGSTKTINSY